MPGSAHHGAVHSIAALLAELAELVGHACHLQQVASGMQEAEDRLELRCILLDSSNDSQLMRSAESGDAPVYFNRAIAEQVAPANYSLAQKLDAAPEGIAKPDALKDQECDWYAVAIENDASDNFGNRLLPGHRYTPFVLGLVCGPASGNWKNTLSRLDTAWEYQIGQDA